MQANIYRQGFPLTNEHVLIFDSLHSAQALALNNYLIGL